MKREKFDKIAGKIAAAKGKVVGLSTTVMASLPMIVQAGNWQTGNGNAGNIVKSIADVVVNIFPFVGAFFLIAGIFKLIMAYRSDQPEGQSAAAKDIVIGAIFIAFRAFVWGAISPVIFA